MRDKGLNKGLVQDFNTDKKGESKAFYGFRQMFWTYLAKMGVQFVDPCCTEASTAGMYPVRYNSALQRLEFYNGTNWLDITGISESTTTTTTV